MAFKNQVLRGISAKRNRGLAGAVSRTVVSPLERMKILFQIQQAGSAAYRGVWPTLVKMWREEGWRGYMRGNGSNCLRIFPYSAIQFASYNLYKPAFLRPGQQELDVTSRLTAGALAGITSVALTYPLDITRTRLSIQCADLAWHANHSHNHSHSLGPSPSQAQPQAQGMWGTMKEIYRCEGGTRALYRGMMPTIYGVAPYVGLNFAVYESVRRWFVSRHGPTSPSREPAAWEKLASGAISGAIAQSLTYPFDVLRRRFQVNNMPGMPHRYNTVWDAIKAISAKEGIRGFYQGLKPASPPSYLLMHPKDSGQICSKSCPACPPAG